MLLGATCSLKLAYRGRCEGDVNDDSWLPLPTLLSHALTAFAIEFDNEFEHRVLEPTGLTYARWRSRPGQYLLSLGGWAKYLRHLREGLGVEEFAALGRLTPAGLRSRLFNLSRWGFVDVVPQVDLKKKVPASGSRVELSAAGRDYWVLWEPLTGVVEARWEKRFGTQPVSRLRACLAEVVRQIDPQIPDFLPIVSSRHRAMPFCSEHDPPLGSFAPDPNLGVDALPLYALLGRVLQAFAADFEQRSAFSLTALANFVRPLEAGPVAVAELPRHAGISEAAIMQATRYLTNAKLAVLEPVSGAKGKQLRLTDRGLGAYADCATNLRLLEGSWEARFGTGWMDPLRDVLNELVVSRDLAASPLRHGLTAADVCWRASLPPPATLPEYPMILGRGWWPDGA